MKKNWRRMRRSIDTAGWASVFVGVGVLMGVMLSIGLFAFPPLRQPPIAGPLSLEYLDLIAQRGMNDAAWWMVVITAASSVVGGFGLVLIARTLQEAKRSADAAHKQVEVASALGQAEIRAYLSASAVTAKRVSERIEVAITITNSGASPAKTPLLAAWAQAGKGWDRESDWLWRTDPETEYMVDIAAGASQSYTFSFDAASGWKRKARRELVDRLIVTGDVEYFDVFRIHQFQRFSFWLPDPNENLIADELQLEWVSMEPHEFERMLY